MGLINSLLNRVFPLRTSDRQAIWKAFGSFQANQFAMGGTGMIDNSYEKNVDVYSIIRKIVDITKSLEWIVEEWNGTEWVEINNTSLHELMYSPNVSKGYTWNDIEEQVLTYLLATGNSYMVGNTQFNGNLIEEVDVIPSNKVEIIVKNKNFFMPDIIYKFELENAVYKFDKSQLAHIKLFNPSYSTVEESLYGLSPVQVAAKVIQTGNDRWDADANLLQNRGAIGMITDKSNTPMRPAEAEKVQSEFDGRIAGTSKFGKTVVTNKDLSYIQMAMSSVDLQLIEKGVVNLRALCNVYGVDSSLFNDPENKTYNNRLEAEKALYSNAIMPLSDKISEVFTNFLVTNHFPDRKVRMRQDFSQVESLQKNLKEKAEIFSMLKREGIISVETAALMLDVEPAKPIKINNEDNKPIV